MPPGVKRILDGTTEVPVFVREPATTLDIPIGKNKPGE